MARSKGGEQAIFINHSVDIERKRTRDFHQSFDGWRAGDLSAIFINHSTDVVPSCILLRFRDEYGGV
jgi:hypothetical protein